MNLCFRLPLTSPLPRHSVSTRSMTATLGILLAVICAASSAPSAHAQASYIYTLAGNGFIGYSGDGGPATQAELNQPNSSVIDTAGNLYIADSYNNVIRRVAATTKLITTIAGTGTAGYSGDAGAATSAQLNSPYSLALDSSGDLYFTDLNNNAVRRIAAATGVITTVAGNGTAGFGGDGGLAVSAQLNYPTGIAFDTSGNLYISDTGNSRIRAIAANGTIRTVAGSGTDAGSTGDGGPATAAGLYGPIGIAVDSAANIYIAEYSGQVVRKVTAGTGVISTVAGSLPYPGYFGFGYSGDGGPATSAVLSFPKAVAVDGAANLYIADSFNQAIRKVTASTGIINTIVGNGLGNAAGCVFGGDGGLAGSASLCYPEGISVDGAGNLYITDGFSQIRMATPVELPPTVATAAPTLSLPAGTYDSPQTVAISDATPGAMIYLTTDGTPPPSIYSSGYNGPIDASGNVTVRAVAVAPGHLASAPVSATYTITSPPASVITTIAGSGVSGISGAGGPATSAHIGAVQAITVDKAGNRLLVDTTNHVVWRVSASNGNISIVAGNGTPGYSGDGGLATHAQLYFPQGIAVDGSGNIYISDTDNEVIREVTASDGVIHTIAGVYGHSGYPGSPGVPANTGNGGPASSAYLNTPYDLAFDAAGNLYIADSGDHEVRVISASTGIITSFAGNGSFSFGGEGGPAIDATLQEPDTLAFDKGGNLYIGDYTIGRVLKVTAATGILTTVAGNGIPYGSDGDGGPALGALIYPRGLALDSAGDLFIANFPGTIREVLQPLASSPG